MWWSDLPKVTQQSPGKAWISTYSTPNSLYAGLFAFPSPSFPKFKLSPKDYEAKLEPCPWQHTAHTHTHTHTHTHITWEMVGTQASVSLPLRVWTLSQVVSLGLGSRRQISRKRFPDTAQPDRAVFPWVQKAASVSQIAEARSTLTTCSFPSQSG